MPTINTKIRKPTKATLKKWAAMTDRNEHEECIIAVAKWFFKKTNDTMFSKFAAATKYILDQHLEIGYLTEELDTLRYCLLKQMNQRMMYYLPEHFKEIAVCM